MRIPGSALTATVDPRRGAKITSLVDAAGTEWLSQGAPDAPAGPGLPFVEAEMRGWDECAPTIVACVVDGHALPDHGDLWDMEFTAEDGRVTAMGASLPYRIERRISATATGLRLDYSAEALEFPMPFLWAAHPQFAAPPGTRVELSVEVVVDVMDAAAPALGWTTDLAAIDTVPAGGCRKVYAAPDHPVDRARLVRADGSALDIRWSPECPYVGVWFDAGAYSAVPVIAIEPATAYYDSLELAVRLGRAPVLEPDVPLAWWVELEVQPAH